MLTACALSMHRKVQWAPALGTASDWGQRCMPGFSNCQAGKRFDVVVVDSRPLFEGRRMLTTLLSGGITCEYCHLNGLSYEITEVDKVRHNPVPHRSHCLVSPPLPRVDQLSGAVMKPGRPGA